MFSLKNSLLCCCCCLCCYTTPSLFFCCCCCYRCDAACCWCWCRCLCAILWQLLQTLLFFLLPPLMYPPLFTLVPKLTVYTSATVIVIAVRTANSSSINTRSCLSCRCLVGVPLKSGAVRDDFCVRYSGTHTILCFFVTVIFMHVLTLEYLRKTVVFSTRSTSVAVPVLHCPAITVGLKLYIRYPIMLYMSTNEGYDDRSPNV